MTQPAPAEGILLTCKNHPDKRWFQTPGSTVIHFDGENGKKDHHGLIPPFKTVMREIISGKAAKRDEPIEFTPWDVRNVANQYLEWETVYAFECDCPTEQLIRVNEGEGDA
jgi:hypothetical protein